MSKEREVIYEPHPVSLERKKELIGQGYRIVDAQFAPDAYKAALKASSEGGEPKTREGLDSAISALPGDQTDPDYVVNSMRSYYGDLFTEADEQLVRDAVKAPAKSPSHGLRIEAIKAKLTEKGIAFEESAERPALAKLLDEAPK